MRTPTEPRPFLEPQPTYMTWRVRPLEAKDELFEVSVRAAFKHGRHSHTSLKVTRANAGDFSLHTRAALSGIASSLAHDLYAKMYGGQQSWVGPWQWHPNDHPFPGIMEALQTKYSFTTPDPDGDDFSLCMEYQLHDDILYIFAGMGNRSTYMIPILQLMTDFELATFIWRNANRLAFEEGYTRWHWFEKDPYHDLWAKRGGPYPDVDLDLYAHWEVSLAYAKIPLLKLTISHNGKDASMEIPVRPQISSEQFVNYIHDRVRLLARERGRAGVSWTGGAPTIEAIDKALVRREPAPKGLSDDLPTQLAQLEQLKETAFHHLPNDLDEIEEDE